MNLSWVKEDAAPEACAASPPAVQAASLISLLAREIERDETEAFRDCSLTPPQYAIARSLAAGPLMMTELARVGCCVPANATALVDRLVRKGLAERIPDPTDRRITRVALTAAGQGAVADTATHLGGRQDRLTAALPERDLAAIVPVLGRLYVALAAGGSECAGSVATEKRSP